MTDRDLKLKVSVDDKASKPLRQIGDAADDTADDLGDLNQGLKALDKLADDAQRTVKALREDIARTGDLGLIKDITKQERALKTFDRQRKALLGPDTGAAAAEEFSAGFAGRVGPLLASAPISPPLVAAFGAAASVAAPILSAAVTGAVGVGAVGAGLAIAARDPQLKAAAATLKTEIGQQLEQAAAPFVPAALDALAIVRGAARTLDGDLQALFSDAARYVTPLTRGLAGAAQALTADLRDVVGNAEPVVTVLGENLPRIADAAGDALVGLSTNAEYTAQSFDGLLTSLELTIRGTGKLLETVNTVYPYLGPGLLPWIGLLSDGEQANKNLAPAVLEAARAQREQTEAARAAFEALRDQRDANLSAADSELRLAESVATATEAANVNGRATDLNTEKGRANRQALLGVARSAAAAAEDVRRMTGNQTDANAILTQARGQFVRLAESMGFSARQAAALADRLLSIPNVTRRVVIRYTTAGDVKTIDGTLIRGASTGGPVTGPGPKGVDSVPYLLAPGEHILSAREVDALGGQQAVETLRRSLRTGPGPTPAPVSPSPSTGGPVMPPEVRIYIGTREITDIVRVEVAERDRRNAIYAGLNHRVG